MATITCCATCGYFCTMVTTKKMIYSCGYKGYPGEELTEDRYIHVCEKWRPRA